MLLWALFPNSISVKNRLCCVIRSEDQTAWNWVILIQHPACQQWSRTAHPWQRYSTQNQLWYHLWCRRQVQRPDAHVGRNLQEARAIKLICTDRDRTGGHCTSAISKRSGPVDKSQLPTGERLRSVTLYEKAFPLSKQCSKSAHDQFLSDLANILPSCVTPLIISDAGFKVPWYKSVEEHKQLVRLYAKRMQIEETFRDLKSPAYGLGLRQSRTSCPKGSILFCW